MVAVEGLDRNHRQTNPQFSAFYSKKLGTTRYRNPLGWRQKRECQIRLTQAFAQLHARLDHDRLRAFKLRAAIRGSRSKLARRPIQLEIRH
jgi:hypothetical protein